jgi:hypothetical protein
MRILQRRIFVRAVALVAGLVVVNDDVQPVLGNARRAFPGEGEKYTKNSQCEYDEYEGLFYLQASFRFDILS